MESIVSQQSPIPTLETPRLRLRPHTLADFPHLLALWSDPTVIRHTVHRPQTQEECWSRLLRYRGQWTLLGFGTWLVEERATGTFVGDAGLLNSHRDITPPLGDTPEIGWSLLPHFHGKGYATEAARAILDWARHPPLAASTFVCIISPDNPASQRVAAKLGFIRRKGLSVIYRGEPIDILDLDPR